VADAKNVRIKAAVIFRLEATQLIY